MFKVSQILPEYRIYSNCIDLIKDYETYVKKGGTDCVALDTETTGLDIQSDVVCYVTIAWGWEDGVNGVRALLDMDAVLANDFALWITDPSRRIIMANAPFDMHLLYNMGLPEIRGHIDDVIVMCHLRDENRFQKTIKFQAPDYLGISMKSFKETFDLNGKNEGMMLLDLPIDQVAHYATLDAWVTLGLFHSHKEYLENYSLPRNYFNLTTLYDYYLKIEVPLIKTLWCMERRGFRIDKKKVESLLAPIEIELTDLNKEILHEAKMPINPRSTKQLSKLFFGKKEDGGMGLKKIKETEKGNVSTDDEVLSKLSSMGITLATKIVRYRALYKNKSTYLLPMLEKADRKDRIHTRLLQARTATGRLSSKDPNLQNIPAKSAFGQAIREAFIPLYPDHTLIVADYSQMEMCIMAEIAGEDSMVEAIKNGLDIHSQTASSMLGAPYELIIASKVLGDLEENDDAEEIFAKKNLPLDALEFLRKNPSKVKELLAARSAAKAIGFGLIYGSGPASLAETLGISLKESKLRIKQFFATYPKLKLFIDGIHRFIQNDPSHTIHTVFGRPRRLHGITSSNRGIAAMCRRQAVNFTVQGSAACIMKHVMNELHNDSIIGSGTLEGGKYGCKMLLQVHDEIILSCKKEYAAEINARLLQIMEQTIKFNVPLRATGGIAASWGEAK